MNKELTVRDLLSFLQSVVDDLPVGANPPVQIAMNGEYQWTAESVTLETVDGEPFILIADYEG